MSESQLRPRNAALRIISVVCLCSFGYAVLRYHVAGPVPWKDLPFFIFNKGVSLSAFVLLMCNFTFGPMRNVGVNIPESWLNARRALGMTGFLLVLIHALMSFMIFTPSIFGKFFEADGSLTLAAGLSMLGGILAFAVLWAYNLSFQTHLREDTVFIGFITSRKFLLGAMLLTLVHLFFMGYTGWLDTSGWQHGLPPISLIAFVLFAISYGFNLAGRR